MPFIDSQHLGVRNLIPAKANFHFSYKEGNVKALHTSNLQRKGRQGQKGREAEGEGDRKEGKKEGRDRQSTWSQIRVDSHQL